jgi:hypothetical protein
VGFRYASTARFVYRSLLVLPVALAVSAQAEWKILSAELEPGPAGIEHRHVVMEDTAGQRVTVDVAVFPAKSTALRVIDNPAGQSLAAVMKREKYGCGVNGGYFDTDFKPIGLRVADGTTFSPLRRARLITGILLQSDRGIDVVRVSEFSRTKKIIGRNSSRTISRRSKQAYSRSERFTAGAANLRRNSHERSCLPRFLLGRFTFGVSRHARYNAHLCGFENASRNESRRWFLERVLVRTRGRQRILNIRTKTGARFCCRRSEMTCRGVRVRRRS